jgi:flavodoxin
MGTLIVYDSVYGNTERIAKAIGNAIPGEVKVLRAGQVDASELKNLDLLIVGAPTQGGRPTQAIQAFLGQGPMLSLGGTRVAAFDTRLTAKWVRIFGYAAPKIADRLKQQGGTVIGSAGGFFVRGKEGPLIEGEAERAANWAKEIAESLI